MGGSRGGGWRINPAILEAAADLKSLPYSQLPSVLMVLYYGRLFPSFVLAFLVTPPHWQCGSCLLMLLMFALLGCIVHHHVSAAASSTLAKKPLSSPLFPVVFFLNNPSLLLLLVSTAEFHHYLLVFTGASVLICWADCRAAISRFRACCFGVLLLARNCVQSTFGLQVQRLRLCMLVGFEIRSLLHPGSSILQDVIEGAGCSVGHL